MNEYNHKSRVGASRLGRHVISVISVAEWNDYLPKSNHRDEIQEADVSFLSLFEEWIGYFRRWE